jgi:Tfp pilus assembly protein PilN
MTEQNINLLEIVELPKLPWYLYPKFVGTILGSFFALLMFIYFANFMSYKQSFAQIDNLIAAKNEITDQMMALQNRIIPKDKLDAAKTVAPRKNLEFSAYLEKLAAYTPRGIWLQSINIDQKIGTYAIAGKANNAAILSSFVKTIEQKNVFLGEKLNNLSIVTEEQGNLNSFTLSNITNISSNRSQ